MDTRRGAFLIFLTGTLVAGTPAGARAEDTTGYDLTLQAARDLARTRAPRLRAAQARADIAAGKMAGEEVWPPFNPEIEVGAGPRMGGEDGTSTDVEVTLGQRFELGQRRGARVDRARARVHRARAEADDTVRLLLYDVSVAFARVLHAEASVAVAREDEEVAAELRRIATKRHELGDVGVLDVNVAVTTHLRRQASVGLFRAEQVRALARLRTLLDLDPNAPVRLRGDLHERRDYELGALLEAAGGRADLRAVAAAEEESGATRRLGEGFAWPDVGLSASYGREEGADIVMGGVGVSLPVFDRGQGLRAAGRAGERAAQRELASLRRAIDTEVRAALAAYRFLDETAFKFEREGLPRLQESLDLARESYRLGNIPLGELLVLQREITESRFAHLDLLFEVAVAATEVEASAGLLQ